MTKKISSAAISALRTGLETIERQSGWTANDPALPELKRILVARIAELEAVEEGALQESGKSPDDSF